MPLLGFRESRALLAKYQLPLAKSAFAKTPGALLKAAEGISPPFVLKATGPNIKHKTERGLVNVCIHTREELLHAAQKMAAQARGEDAVLVVQETLRGAELIIGAKRDASFGPVVLFGTGGIYAELLDDVAVRTAPLSRKDALEMIASTKARKFFEGFRGMKANREEIVSLLLKTSRLVEKEKSVVELDFNPVIAGENGAFIVDARLVVE